MTPHARIQPQQRAAQPAIEITDGKGFHAALLDLNTRYVRYYPAIAVLFEPYAAAGKSEALTGEGSGPTRTRGSTFDPELAALMLVRVIDLAGLSTRSDIECVDEFEKSDTEFALELGITLHRFRAVRRFLADDVNLVERRTVRLPNRSFYRPVWSRIQQFLFGTDAGMGWGQMPLAGVQGSAADVPAQARGRPSPSDELTNSECVNNTLGVTKKPTPSDEKTHSYREDLYRKDCTEKTKKDVVVVERSEAKAAWATSLEGLIRRNLGIEQPASQQLSNLLADVWADAKRPHEIALRLDQGLSALQGIQSITNPVGVLITDVRRDPLLTGKRYEVTS